MPLTLEQYASYLDTREDLPWPVAPDVDQPKVKPHLKRLPEIRVVMWSAYGTLISIAGGELYFKHPKELMMTVALDKTLQEFKMWGSMTRKPGQPSEYLGQLYEQELDKQKGVSVGGERHPEVRAERIWEALVKKLLQKEYSWDTGFYGSLNQLSEKIAYFFHTSLQGTGCYEKAARTLRKIQGKGITQGLLADGQCFSTIQLKRGLQQQEENFSTQLFTAELCFLSHEIGARKPSETLFEAALDILLQKGFEKHEILHVGASIEKDVAPARKLGMKTALFAGDRASLCATPEQLKDNKVRPDVMVTELRQVAEIVG